MILVKTVLEEVVVDDGSVIVNNNHEMSDTLIKSLICVDMSVAQVTHLDHLDCDRI